MEAIRFRTKSRRLREHLVFRKAKEQVVACDSLLDYFRIYLLIPLAWRAPARSGSSKELQEVRISIESAPEVITPAFITRPLSPSKLEGLDGLHVTLKRIHQLRMLRRTRRWAKATKVRVHSSQVSRRYGEPNKGILETSISSARSARSQER